MDKKNQEIENLKYQINKIDGKKSFYNITNRVYGLGKIGFQIFLYYATNKNPWILLYAPIALDGLADLITGKHHTLISRLFKVHPKYKLEKLIKE